MFFIYLFTTLDENRSIISPKYINNDFEKVKNKAILNTINKINFILFFILIFGIYFNYINHDYGLSWWIDNSLDRIIYQISGFFIIVVPTLLNNIKN